MPDKPHWLRAEETGQEELAESAFARLVADLPSFEPSSAFVDRAAHAAWRARIRRRLVTRVACVAAALARDVRTFREAGWRLAALRAVDAFPMTQHVECVALLVPPDAS